MKSVWLTMNRNIHIYTNTRLTGHVKDQLHITISPISPRKPSYLKARENNQTVCRKSLRSQRYASLGELIPDSRCSHTAWVPQDITVQSMGPGSEPTLSDFNRGAKNIPRQMVPQITGPSVMRGFLNDNEHPELQPEMIW